MRQGKNGRLRGDNLGSYPGPIWQGSQTCSLHTPCPIWVLALALYVLFSRPETGPIFAPASHSPPGFSFILFTPTARLQTARQSHTPFNYGDQ